MWMKKNSTDEMDAAPEQMDWLGLKKKTPAKYFQMLHLNFIISNLSFRAVCILSHNHACSAWHKTPEKFIYINLIWFDLISFFFLIFVQITIIFFLAGFPWIASIVSDENEHIYIHRKYDE